MLKIPYSPQESGIFGTIGRPLITMLIFSKVKNVWIPIYETLADTGADITLIPRYLGEMIVDDITKGKHIEVKGIVPNAVLPGFIHILKLEVFRKQFETKVLIADTDDARPILGRFNSLDLFEVGFNKGKEIIVN